LSALIRSLLVFAVSASLFGVARAAECAYTSVPETRLQNLTAVSDYRPVLKRCVAADGRRSVAIREMTLGGERISLLADPEALTTRLERAACWRCEDESEEDLASTRMGRAISESAEAPGLAHRGFLQNAGLTRGAAPGAFVTGDLCPSKRPLDRTFFTRLETMSARAPVALAISGVWLLHHFEDFRWLAAQRDTGRLDILWIDHSFSHPYRRRVPTAANFLLARGVDAPKEVLDTERLLIANGETPSLFFRFPGLVSSDPLMQAVRRFDLVTLGADAWLANGERPERGSIVLVHPNGNEPQGLAMFAKDVAHGTIAAPLEPLTAAPE
jgi:hypothetical protein